MSTISIILFRGSLRDLFYCSKTFLTEDSQVWLGINLISMIFFFFETEILLTRVIGLFLNNTIRFWIWYIFTSFCDFYYVCCIDWKPKLNIPQNYSPTNKKKLVKSYHSTMMFDNFSCKECFEQKNSVYIFGRWCRWHIMSEFSACVDCPVPAYNHTLTNSLSLTTNINVGGSYEIAYCLNNTP